MREKPEANTTPTLFEVGDQHLVVLPYGGTSGWSGSDTSEERAQRQDKNGTTGQNQKRTLSLLLFSRDEGLTWKELSDKTGWHHGTASGALSVLHKAGLIARLTERRLKCAVYVAPAFVNGRETQTHRPNISARLLTEILDELESDLENGNLSLALARVKATKKAMQ
jgi:DNA-binding MarR family transcriptional regulator